jgi:2-methylfumaryl-CoA isomerase
VAVLAAVHRRRETGAGSHVTVSLEDVATSTLTTLGLLSEAHQLGRSRERIGNAVYGTFGMDAALRDGTVVMVATVTDRQWAELVAVTGRSAAVEAIEATLPADFSDEGARYRHRAVLVGLLRPWFAQRTLAEVTAALEQTHILWSPFRELVDLAADVAAGRSDVARLVDEPGLGEHLATSGPLRFRGEAAPDIPATPSLGEHGLQA